MTSSIDQRVSMYQGSLTLFVGNLSPSTSESDLKVYFSQFGAVVRAKVIVDLHSHQSKHCGLIFCSDSHTANSILEWQPHELHGRVLRIENAIENRISTKCSPHRTLFVSGLRLTTSEETVANYFSQFGEVLLVKLVPLTPTKRNPDTRIANIVFKYDGVVEELLSKKRKVHRIEGQRIFLDRLKDKKSPVQSPQGVEPRYLARSQMRVFPQPPRSALVSETPSSSEPIWNTEVDYPHEDWSDPSNGSYTPSPQQGSVGRVHGQGPTRNIMPICSKYLHNPSESPVFSHGEFESRSTYTHDVSYQAYEQYVHAPNFVPQYCQASPLQYPYTHYNYPEWDNLPHVNNQEIDEQHRLMAQPYNLQTDEYNGYQEVDDNYEFNREEEKASSNYVMRMQLQKDNLFNIFCPNPSLRPMYNAPLPQFDQNQQKRTRVF